MDIDFLYFDSYRILPHRIDDTDDPVEAMMDWNRIHALIFLEDCSLAEYFQFIIKGYRDKRPVSTRMAHMLLDSPLEDDGETNRPISRSVNDVLDIQFKEAIFPRQAEPGKETGFTEIKIILKSPFPKFDEVILETGGDKVTRVSSSEGDKYQFSDSPIDYILVRENKAFLMKLHGPED